MYYYKLTHAFGPNTNRPIAFQWLDQIGDFDKQRTEWEIVGALASDPIAIANIISGDGTTPTTTVTVDTDVPHYLILVLLLELLVSTLPTITSVRL